MIIFIRNRSRNFSQFSVLCLLSWSTLRRVAFDLSTLSADSADRDTSYFIPYPNFRILTFGDFQVPLMIRARISYPHWWAMYTAAHVLSDQTTHSYRNGLTRTLRRLSEASAPGPGEDLPFAFSYAPMCHFSDFHRAQPTFSCESALEHTTSSDSRAYRPGQ